jgi:integrase
MGGYSCTERKQEFLFMFLCRQMWSKCFMGCRIPIHAISFGAVTGTLKQPRRDGSEVFDTCSRTLQITKPDGTLKRCHPHMFRDTFAVELLLSGVPIDQVSLLLGHSSVKITEKHYAPFVQTRQEQLEGSVKLSWQVQAKWMETEKLGVVMRM